MEVTAEITAAVKNVPALRFPEFEGEWVNTTLGDFLTFKNGVNADKEKYGSGYKFINVMDIINNRFITHDKIIGSVEISEKEFVKNEVKYGDILFQRSSETREEVGQSNVYLDKEKSATFGGFVIRGQATKEYNPLFMHFLLKTDFARKEITTKSGGSTRYNVGQESLREVNVILPNIAEQQKIASFLTIVDDKIQQLSNKKGLLEKYKDGVMQQIFSQQIRFKDGNGNNFPEWTTSKIGVLSNVIAGGTPSTLKPDYWGGDIRWMNSGELNLKRVFEVENRITEEGVKNSSTKLLPKYCVMIGLAGQGKTRGTVAINHIEVCTNQSIASILPNQELFNSDFLYHNLDMRYDELRSLSTGEGGRGGLNLQIIKSMNIDLPCLGEQKKIADFINSIDNKINYTSKQLEQAQQFKKGLLQQLFV